MTGALAANTAANLRLNGRGLPSHISALAILVPHQRGYATEPSSSTSSSSDPLPPPGFNAEQAKKPLAAEQQQQPAKQVVPASEQSVKAPAKTSGTEISNELTTAKSTDADKKTDEKKETKKLTLGQKIKKEAQHYWDGTKLLATEVKISSRLALKMAAGYELSRREHRQVSTAAGFRGQCGQGDTPLLIQPLNENSFAERCPIWDV